MLRPDAEHALPEQLLAQRRAFLEFLQQRVGDRDLAEDILQDSLAKAVERIDSLRDEDAVVAWFYRLLRNAVIDHSRRVGAAARSLDRYARQLQPLTEPDDAHQDQVCACVRALVDTLKPEYAQALHEVELGGRPLGAFAEQAGITANNAGVRVHRARKALRREVLAFCRLCAEHGCRDCTCRRAGGQGGGDVSGVAPHQVEDEEP